jgi:transaldolase
MKSRLQKLAERGQSIWIDNLSRDLVHSGGLQRLIDERAVTGVTSNPTIFQKAISQGNDYDDQLRALFETTDDPREAFFRVAEDDVRDACDVLRPVWERTGGSDGYV